MSTRVPLRIIPIGELRAVKGIQLTKVRIYQLINKGEFPCPVKINGRVGFVEHELDRWIRARMRDSRSKLGKYRRLAVADAVLAGAR